MIAKQYYYLVASLTQYTTDAPSKGFDAALIRDQICEHLSGQHKELVSLIYYFYDIENIVNISKGSSRFNSLANLSHQQLTESMEGQEDLLPAFISDVLAAYKNPESNDNSDIDTTMSLEKSLYTSYYKECLNSENTFIKEYSNFELNLRNVSAAVVARSHSKEVSNYVVGNNYVAQCLKRSTASDFSLRGEIDYLDTVLNAVSNQSDLVGKEKQIDALRWDYADQMVCFDYFTVNQVLSYLTKINTLQRWKDLDSQAGREVFNELISKLVNQNIEQN